MKAWAIAGAICLASCTTTTPPAVAPPRLQMPSAAAEPCSLHRLPEQPTLADLEIALAARGAALVECDGRRRLAVETVQTEHAMQDQWLAHTSPSQGLFSWLNRGRSVDAAGSRP